MKSGSIILLTNEISKTIIWTSEDPYKLVREKYAKNQYIITILETNILYKDSISRKKYWQLVHQTQKDPALLLRQNRNIQDFDLQDEQIQTYYTFTNGKYQKQTKRIKSRVKEEEKEFILNRLEQFEHFNILKASKISNQEEDKQEAFKISYGPLECTKTASLIETEEDLYTKHSDIAYED